MQNANSVVSIVFLCVYLLGPFQTLQDCFESRNIALLQETISKMPEDEARYHLKRCVDSGLWIADASQAAENTEDGAAVKTEPTYEEAGASASTTDPKPTITTDDVD